MVMSRLDRPSSESPPEDQAAEFPPDSARVAEEIGIAVFDLLALARAAGLTSVSHLLELAALEAGAQAATSQMPLDDQTPQAASKPHERR